MEILQANIDLKEFAVDYLKIILIFVVFYVLSYYLETMTKVDAFPVLSFFGVLFGAFLNILLDYIFICKLNMGLEGAAIATGIAQTGTFILFFAYFLSKSKLKFTWFKFKLTELKEILKLGFSDFFTEISTGIIILIFNFFILKYLNKEQMFSYSVIIYVNTLVIMTYIGISQGSLPLISFNYGKKDSLYYRYFKFGLKFTAIISIALTLVSILFSKSIALLFVGKNDPYLIGLISKNIKLFSLGFLFMGINIFISNFFVACLKPKKSYIIVFLRGYLLVPIILFILCEFINPNYLYLAVFFSEFLTLIISVLLLIQFKKIAKIKST